MYGFFLFYLTILYRIISAKFTGMPFISFNYCIYEQFKTKKKEKMIINKKVERSTYILARSDDEEGGHRYDEDKICHKLCTTIS